MSLWPPAPSSQFAFWVCSWSGPSPLGWAACQLCGPLTLSSPSGLMLETHPFLFPEYCFLVWRTQKMLVPCGLLGLTYPSPVEVVVTRGGEGQGWAREEGSLLNSAITIIISWQLKQTRLILPYSTGMSCISLRGMTPLHSQPFWHSSSQVKRFPPQLTHLVAITSCYTRAWTDPHDLPLENGNILCFP